MMAEGPDPLFVLNIAPGATAEATEIGQEFYEPKNGFQWVHFDLGAPELRSWCRNSITLSAVRNLLAPKTRPRIDAFEDGVFLSLRGINLNNGDDRADMVSLRLWITKTRLVSVRRQRVEAANAVHKQIIEGDPPDNITALVARLAEEITRQIEDIADELDVQASLLENAVHNSDTALPGKIADLSRAVIKFRRHIGPQSDALHLLAETESDAIEPHLRHRLFQVAGRTRRAQEELSEIRDRLTTLNEQLLMTQSAKSSRNSYLLSVAAAIFLPLSFITSLVALPFAKMAWHEHPDAFLIYCASMAASAVALFLVFRWTRWF